jgi:Tol biopolymer transport system component
LALVRSLNLDYTSGPAAFAKNGQRVAVRGSGGDDLFLTSDGTLIHTYPPGAYGIYSPSISADGQTLVFQVATPGPNYIVVASALSNTQITVASTTYGFGFSAISPDGNTVVVSDPSVNGTIDLYRASDGSFIRGLAGNTGANAVFFSSDSSLMVALSGTSGTIRIWRLSDVLLLQTVLVKNQDGSAANVAATAFSPVDRR